MDLQGSFPIDFIGAAQSKGHQPLYIRPATKMTTWSASILVR